MSRRNYWFGRARRAERVERFARDLDFRNKAWTWFNRKTWRSNPEPIKNTLLRGIVLGCLLLAGCASPNSDIHTLEDYQSLTHFQAQREAKAEQARKEQLYREQVRAWNKEQDRADRKEADDKRLQAMQAVVQQQVQADEAERVKYASDPQVRAALARWDTMGLWANLSDSELVVTAKFTKLPMPQQQEILETLERVHPQLDTVRLKGYESNPEMYLASFEDGNVVWSRWYAKQKAWKSIP